MASKVVYALDGRPGVTGGPQVAAASYAGHGPGEVVAAQWANAGAGVAVLVLFVLCASPLAERFPKWVLAVPVGLVTVMAVAGAVGMTGRALLTAAGGALFGGYCAVWGVLAAAVLTTLLRRRS